MQKVLFLTSLAMESIYLANPDAMRVSATIWDMAYNLYSPIIHAILSAI